MLAVVSVFLVDNLELVRDAVARLLTTAGLDVAGAAPLRQDCLRSLAEIRPEVVLVEPFVDGAAELQWIGRMAAVVPDSQIMVLTGNQAHHPVVEAILAGAAGYVLKEAPRDEIVGAVRASAAGKGVICPRVADELLERIRRRDLPTKGSNGAASAIRSALSEREVEIFRRLASGRTNEQIAREVVLSEHTVKHHVASILEKLKLDNRVQAAVEAVRSGIA